MNRFLALSLTLAVAGFSPAAHALAPRVGPDVPEMATNAAGNCRAIGQQIARQHGGTLADARVESRGGRQVCVGIVVVPGRNGERPQQIPFSVPM